jgi:hypothetical protein
MGSYESIEEYVKYIADRSPVVHAAVLNAGVAPPSHNLSKEGWGMEL